MSWISMQPWRKPIAVLSVMFTLVLIWHAVRSGTDIPGGVVSVLIAFNGFTIGGYFGSSAYEAVHKDTREDLPPQEIGGES